MIFKNNIILILSVLLLAGCSLPQFSTKPGGKGNQKEIPGKTIQVDFFENKSSLASSTVSASFTEALRDIMLAQTSLDLVATEGDLFFEGYISDYKITPLAIQAGSETAAQNRLTMSVRVNHSYPNLDSTVLNNVNFTSFVDFNSDLDFTSVEEELIEELNNQLTQDIYDKSFGGDW